MALIPHFRFKIRHANELHDRIDHLHEIIVKKEEDSWSHISSRTLWAVVDACLLSLSCSPLMKGGSAGVVLQWVSIGAVVLYIVKSLWLHSRCAPLTKWRRIRTYALCIGLALILAPLYLLIFKELAPEKRSAMYIAMALGVLSLALFGYARVRHRQLRSEAAYQAEQIRRRIARRKKMEML
ncbi:MAG: hypothetical protein IKZ12_00475 [Alistipes sp.]|nr:hypothetical protein [Alistipes sp.]